MKKISILLCVATAIAALSCNKEFQEVQEPQTPQTPQVELQSMTFTATTTETRTVLDEDHVSIKWLSTDKISVWDGHENREFTSNGEGTKVKFTGEAADAQDYLALYPYDENAVFFGSLVKTSLAADQEPVNGTFANGLNINVATSADKSTFYFDNVMSVAKFTLDANKLGGKTIKSVKLTSTYPLAGDVDVLISPDGISASAGDATVTEVTMTSASGLADGTYYFVVLPNAGGDISMTFTATDNSSATITANLKKAFTAGTIKNLGTVQGLTWVAPVWKLVTDASTLAVGDKLVIASNSKGKVASVLSGTYLTEVAASFSSDKNEITLPDEAMQFTLGGTVGAWTLTSSDGQLKSSANKNVNFTSGTGTWVVTIDVNHDATIQNTQSSNGRILHNVNNNRFTTYTSDLTVSMLLPQLYREEPAYSGTPTPEKSIIVTPAASNPETVPAEGCTLSYTVTTTNIDSWEAVSDNADFVVVNKTSDGFDVEVAVNETSSPKSATITVSGGGKSEEFSINQAAGEGPDTPEEQSFILKQSSIPFSGSGYQSYSDITIGGFKFEFEDVMKNGEAGIQLKASSGSLFNTSAIGQQIVSIAFSTTTNSVTVFAGEDEDNLSPVTGNNGTYTFADGVKYFKISTGSKYAVIGEITITYIPDGGGDQPENPTKTVTFTPGTDTGATSVTKSGITVTMTTMNNENYYQIYAKQSMTVESTGCTIKGISFTCTAAGTAQYGPGNVTASTGEYSSESNTGTWVGSTREVSLLASVQVRMTSLTITYVED